MFESRRLQLLDLQGSSLGTWSLRFLSERPRLLSLGGLLFGLQDADILESGWLKFWNLGGLRSRIWRDSVLESCRLKLWNPRGLSFGIWEA